VNTVVVVVVVVVVEVLVDVDVLVVEVLCGAPVVVIFVVVVSGKFVIEIKIVVRVIDEVESDNAELRFSAVELIVALLGEVLVTRSSVFGTIDGISFVCWIIGSTSDSKNINENAGLRNVAAFLLTWSKCCF